MIATLIAGVLVTTAFVFVFWPSIAERRPTELERRSAMLLHKCLADPMFPHTTPFREEAQAIVDDFYKE